MNQQLETSKHHKYGGSKIELTELCPGSVRAISELPARPAGESAERGTRIHAHLQSFLELPSTALEGYADADFSAEQRIAMAAATEVYGLMAEAGVDESALVIEKPVLLDHINPEAGGTPDLWFYRPFGDLYMVDLKTGRNYVKAEENMQLVFYAVGALKQLPEFIRMTLNQIHFIILQPEQEAPYTVHQRRWSVTLQELMPYEMRIKSAVDTAEAEPDKRIAGEHCIGKYCDARRTCPAYQAYANQQSEGLFLQMLQQSDALLPAQTDRGLCSELYGLELAKQLKALPLLKDLCKKIEEDAEAALKRDINCVPGWTLEDKYGHRAWVDEAQAKRILKKFKLKSDDFEPRSILSPAAVKKLLKEKGIEFDVDTLTDRPHIGSKLAKRKEDRDIAALFAEQTNTLNFAP
jgi:hypothetical protein